MSIRYLLDENINPLYKTQLLRKLPGLIVWRVGEPGTPPYGTPDPDVLAWCQVRNFC
jgi:hypothetical protein